MIIIIEAVGVDQDHGAVDDLQPWIQTQEHQKKTCRKRQEEEERDEEAQNCGREQGTVFRGGCFSLF